MTGAEHYAAAEQALATALDSAVPVEEREDAGLAAMVHALLASAAASALPARAKGGAGWLKVLT